MTNPHPDQNPRSCGDNPGEHIHLQMGNATGLFAASFCRQEEARSFAMNVESIMASGQRLKDDVKTSVSRVVWQGREIIIKRYNPQGLLRSLWRTFTGTRAKNAWAHGHLLLRSGIQTPRPLAWIDCRNGPLVTSSYIVTEYIDAPLLYHFLRNSEAGVTQRIQTVRGIVSVFDKLRHRSLSHGDMKHSNILVGSHGLILTDLDAMKRHRIPWLHRRESRKDMERFLRGMLSEDIPEEIAEAFASLAAVTAATSNRADDYTRLSIGPWDILLRRGYPPAVVETIVSPDGSICSDESCFGRVASSDKARVFAASLAVDSARYDVYIKEYLFRSVVDFAKHLFRSSRARRAFYASLMLRSNGFDAPKPLALLEKRLGPFRTESVLVTEAVDGAVPLYRHIEDLAKQGQAALRRKRMVIRHFGSLIGRMHAMGIFHGDLRLGNALVRPEDTAHRFYLIDNERTRQFRHIPERLRIKNLVQINMWYGGVTNTDRLRFIIEYARGNDVDRDTVRRWARWVVRLTTRRLEIRRSRRS